MNSAAPWVMSEADGGQCPDVANRPFSSRTDDPVHADMDPATTVWWALDVSAARGLIARIVRGDRGADWVSGLLERVRVVEANANAIHSLAAYGSGHDMIGRPITAYWPPESREALAQVILAAVASFPAGAPASRPITSIAFQEARVNASIELVILDPRGDTALSGAGELVFRDGKADHVDYLLDWAPVARPSGGDYQLLIRIAGKPMGTWPLKVEKR